MTSQGEKKIQMKSATKEQSDRAKYGVAIKSEFPADRKDAQTKVPLIYFIHLPSY